MAEQTTISNEDVKNSGFSFDTISRSEFDKRQIEQKEAQEKVEKTAEPEPTLPEANNGQLTNDVETKEPTQPKLPEQPQLSFHNEESEKFFNYFKEGKEDELRNFLNEKHKLSSLDSEKNEDIIKLNLQYSNSSYTKEEINDLFEEKYLRPDKPDEVEQGIEESDAEFALRQQKYEKQLEKFNKANEKIDKQIARDARIAKDELAKRKGEIVLPDIPKEQPKANEPTQEELDGMKKFVDAFKKSVVEDVPKFKGFETEYESEGAKYPVKFDVTSDEVKSLQQRFESSNLDLEQEVLGRWFYKDDTGAMKIDTGKAAQDIYLLENFSKIFKKIANESANAALKNHIKTSKNIDYSGSGAPNLTPKPKTKEEVSKEMGDIFFR